METESWDVCCSNITDWKQSVQSDLPVVLLVLEQQQYDCSAPDPSTIWELSACPWTAVLSAGLLGSQEEQTREVYAQSAAIDNIKQFND